MYAIDDSVIGFVVLFLLMMMCKELIFPAQQRL